MGNWITANLEAAIDFFMSMMNNLYDILTINPITYREGKIWEVVNYIYNSILGCAISLMVIFIYLAIIEDIGDIIKHKNYGVLLWTFMKVMLCSGILIYGRYILVLIFSIGKEFIDNIVLRNGSDILYFIGWSDLPAEVINATNNMSLSSGIVLWVVTLIAALVIMVVCFSILLSVYGRIFKIYLHIAISPIPMACFASRTTFNNFVTFIKSFTAVVLEGVVIVVACIIFSAFANNFDLYRPMENVVVEPSDESDDDDDITDLGQDLIDNVIDNIEDPADAIAGNNELQADNAMVVWKYLGQTLFLYLLLAGIIKGANDTVNKMLGV